jgi:hypothetical protein
MSDKQYLNEQQAADFLGVKPKTLQAWRYNQEGPKYYEPRPRVIRYLASDLIDWLGRNNQKKVGVPI